MPASKFFTTTDTVKPEWIDYNGHMNMGFYAVAFDFIATDRYFKWLGIGVDHLASENKSTFTLGTNIDYIREVLEGMPLRFTSQLVDYDHKRLHYFHTMYHAEEGYVAATNECLTLYVDMATRRSTEFSQQQMVLFAEQHELSQVADTPQGFGRKLGIRR